MEKQTKVIDASVVVKWFVNELYSEKALQLKEEQKRGETLLIAPELLFIEVFNALIRKEKNEKIMLQVNEALENMELKIIKSNHSILMKSLQLSFKYNITIYDALYVAIAQVHGIPFITADKELFKIPNAIPLEKMYLL